MEERGGDKEDRRESRHRCESEMGKKERRKRDEETEGREETKERSAGRGEGDRAEMVT